MGCEFVRGWCWWDRGVFTCCSWARVMRMTEGNLAWAAPGGMAGSFLWPGERVAQDWEAWHEEEEEEGWWWWW